MKIKIYYGGRGFIEDPTIYVLDRMTIALSELKVDVERYNIYEQKNSVSTLVNTLNDADGVIFATTVEWMGIGGHMTQFLDALWFYANKEELSDIYMMPVVISTTYGERESLLALENAWEILGGLPCSGLCGYVEDISSFTENLEYRRVIEKKAEYLYRTISQRSKGLPNSNKAVSKTVLRTQQLNLTHEESEQMSFYAADDKYVEQQKQDISELSSLYKNLLGKATANNETDYASVFKNHFDSGTGINARFQFEIEGKDSPLLVLVEGDQLNIEQRFDDNVDILARIDSDTMNEIILGRLSFLKAFSSGKMTAKGHFSDLRKLDEIFKFQI